MLYEDSKELLFVEKLSEFLSPEQTKKVLELMDEICHECWNNYSGGVGIGCQCWNDE